MQALGKILILRSLSVPVMSERHFFDTRISHESENPKIGDCPNKVARFLWSRFGSRFVVVRCISRVKAYSLYYCT